MTNWTGETYNNNHLRLMRFHRGLAVFYAVLIVPIAAFVDELAASIALGLLAVVVVHTLLAIGCQRKTEHARKASEFVGMLMLFGFPVGTLLGYFLLQRTYWAAPEN